MRTTTTLAVTGALLLALTGCTSSRDAKPVETVTATTTASPSVDKARVTQACMDAVAEIPADESGEVPSEPTPAACAPLSDSEYLDAYMDGIIQGNREGIAERERQASEAAEADQP